MNRKSLLSKVLAGSLLVVVIAAFVFLDLGSRLTLDSLKQQHGALSRLYVEHPARTLAAFFALYALSTGASLPGATVLTIASGALFGVITGAAVVSVASTTGATLAFLSSRFLLRDFVQTRFSERLQAINSGMERSGLLYLFSLRLVPVIPFFVLNLAMGVTRIPLLHYCLVSLVGMLPATILYANAGTQLAQLESPTAILSIDVVAAFAALGLLPFAARRFLHLLRARAALGR